MCHVAALVERSIKEAMAAYVKKKWSMPQPLYPSKTLAVGGSSRLGAKKSFPKN